MKSLSLTVPKIWSRLTVLFCTESQSHWQTGRKLDIGGGGAYKFLSYTYWQQSMKGCVKMYFLWKPSTWDNINNCTLTNKAVGSCFTSLAHSSSETSVPRPPWLSALGPALAYRWDAHFQATSTDVNRYIWYYIFITIVVSVLHFYDLSVLVGS